MGVALWIWACSRAAPAPWVCAFAAMAMVASARAAAVKVRVSFRIGLLPSAFALHRLPDGTRRKEGGGPPGLFFGPFASARHQTGGTALDGRSQGIPGSRSTDFPGPEVFSSHMCHGRNAATEGSRPGLDSCSCIVLCSLFVPRKFRRKQGQEQWFVQLQKRSWHWPRSASSSPRWRSGRRCLASFEVPRGFGGLNSGEILPPRR